MATHTEGEGRSIKEDKGDFGRILGLFGVVLESFKRAR